MGSWRFPTATWHSLEYQKLIQLASLQAQINTPAQSAIQWSQKECSAYRWIVPCVSFTPLLYNSCKVPGGYYDMVAILPIYNFPYPSIDRSIRIIFFSVHNDEHSLSTPLIECERQHFCEYAEQQMSSNDIISENPADDDVPGSMCSFPGMCKGLEDQLNAFTVRRRNAFEPVSEDSSQLLSACPFPSCRGLVRELCPTIVL